ncbi:MAG: WGR domain-containing protein, partial [Chloroflexi bacterium]
MMTGLCLLHRREGDMARFYVVQVGRSLLGEPAVVRFWGRLGAQQRHVVTVCSSEDEAYRLARRLVRTRLRRGYRIVQNNIPDLD